MNPGPHAGVVKMCGLPSDVVMEDILEFFSGFEVLPESLVICQSHDHSGCSGEAIVAFPSQDEAQQATDDRNMECLLDMRIELLPSSVDEAERAARGQPSGGGGGGGGGAAYIDVEDFIRRSGLDDAAANAFRSCDPAVQDIVMEKGVEGTRNPSSALMAAIRRAKQEVNASDRGRAAPPPPKAAVEPLPPPVVESAEDLEAQVEDYCSRNGVDEGALAMLKTCSEAIQVSILQRGDLNKARNPSSMLIAWIKEVKSSAPPEAHHHAQGGGPRGDRRDAAPPPAAEPERLPEEMDVEEFLASGGVDDGAADILRECSPATQRAVMSRGNFKNARNPSSVLYARIREARAAAGKPQGEIIHEAVYVRVGGIPYSAKREDIVSYFEGFSFYPEGVIVGATREGRPSGEAYVPFHSEQDAEEAISSKDKGYIGDRYVELFMSSAEEVQRTASGGGGGGAKGQDYDRNRSDRHAPAPDYRDHRPSEPIPAYRDRARGPDHGSGPIGADPRNNNRRGPSPRGAAPSSNRPARGASQREVEDFIGTYDIDSMASEALRSCDPVQQREIIEVMYDKGIEKARNPSSALMAELRHAGIAGNRRGPPDAAPPPRGAGAGGGGGRGRPPQDRHMDEVYEFLDAHNMDERAREAMLSTSRRVQEAVLDRGRFDQHVRNPSAALLARIRDAEKEERVPDNSYGRRSDEPPPSTRPRFESHGGGGRQQQGPSLARQVDDFVQEHALDDKAAKMLRECPESVQRLALGRGLTGARNPSAALTAALTTMLKEDRAAAPPPAPSSRRDPPRQETYPPPRRDYPPPQPAYGSRPPPPVDDRRQDRSRDDRRPRPPPPSSRYGRTIKDDVEDFIRRHNVDDASANSLRDAPPEVQGRVLEKDLEGARNPSSALVARIRTAKQDLGMGGSRPPQPRGGGGGYRSRSPRRPTGRVGGR